MARSHHAFRLFAFLMLILILPGLLERAHHDPAPAASAFRLQAGHFSLALASSSGPTINF